MFGIAKKTEHKNPDGLTRDEFMKKYSDIPELAAICWYFGVYPEQLKAELEKLKEKY